MEQIISLVQRSVPFFQWGSKCSYVPAAFIVVRITMAWIPRTNDEEESYGVIG